MHRRAVDIYGTSVPDDAVIRVNRRVAFSAANRGVIAAGRVKYSTTD